MIVFTWIYLVFLLRCLQVHSADPCEEYRSCQACARAVPSCKWCSSDTFKKSQRCMPAAAAFTECPADKIVSPKGSISATGYDNDFNKVTQIKPQRFKIKLRPGESQAFNFFIKPSPNFPADLYFLLDSSTTMTTALQSTARAATKIYESMRKNTDDVLIGMGTFVDKNAAPFVREKDSINPISSFTHKLNLTNDIGLFEKLVNDLAKNTKKNYDLREGGFDALAQAITCDVGWREMSRKIIFFMTDDLSHTAGDGKFAGIVYPYDGECYTDSNGTYTKELEMDYPSIGMISELARREGVTIIFLADGDKSAIYSKIATDIHGSQAIKFKRTEETILFEESFNKRLPLEKLLSKMYKDISKTVKFDTTMTHMEENNINISFEPNCDGNKNDACTIPIDAKEAKHFQGNISLLNYYGENKINLHVSIGSGIKEKLILDIEVVDCDCKDEEKESPYCSGHGTKKCGACECENNRIGDNCKCMLNDNQMTTLADDDRGCKPEGDKEHLPCNGKGFCECGNCRCNQGREGKFCECIKNNCVDKCNGHGKCFCGVCTCDQGWSGESCACSQDPCKIVNGKTCNGRGRCHCGSCKCEDRASWDARVNQNRATCEMNPCTNCHSDQCQKLEYCARCRINDEPDCPVTCQGIRVGFVEVLNATTNGSICDNVKVGLGCYTRFSYEYDDVKYQINLLIQRENNCIESYYWWGGGVLAVLVVVGILTLVGWKVLTDWRDRQEYRSFLKQHHADSDLSCRNPIYEPASTTIRNPVFRKPSVDFTSR